MMTDDSYLTLNKDARVTSYVGPDATMLFRAKTIRMGLVGWQKHKMVMTRGATITKLLAWTGAITGKKYKRTQIADAIVDLDMWINTMVAALPVEVTS